MNNVYLHGALAEEFGPKFEFEIATVDEVFQALRANFPRFANAIRKGFYSVILGKNAEEGIELAEDEIRGFRAGGQDIHIVPVIEGHKRGGLGKIISGIALIGLSIASGGAAATGLLGQTLWTGTNVAQMAGTMGTGLLLTGVASLLAPEIKAESTQESFTMSGPTTDLKEGAIIPIAYGEVISGGYMITGGIQIKDRSSTSAPPTAPSFNPLTLLGGKDFKGGSVKEPAIPGGRPFPGVTD